MNISKKYEMIYEIKKNLKHYPLECLYLLREANDEAIRDIIISLDKKIGDFQDENGENNI